MQPLTAQRIDHKHQQKSGTSGVRKQVFCGHPSGTVALTWLSGLCVPMTPRAMPAGVFTPLVGPPKPERSRSRVQTKVSPMALQVWALGLRLTTSSRKNFLLQTASGNARN